MGQNAGDTPGASVPERAESISRHLDDLLERQTEAGDRVDTPGWYRALLDAATGRMARVRGVFAGGWIEETVDFEELHRRLEQWPDELWDDPHALGWIHEQYAGRARRDSFDGHVHREEKHASSTVTTQLYTPRWIADVLVGEAMEIADCGDRDPKVVDPAVGGGQMLLAALDRFADRSPDADPVRWVRPLWGIDLDESAVEVARRTVALEIARRTGERSGDAEQILWRQIEVGNGLEVGDEGGWDVAVTNPPYMGWRSMPENLRDQLDPRFRPYHRDLFSAFIDRCHELADGAVGILAQQSIWYLRRFEKARRDLLNRGWLARFVHLGSGAFWNLDGEKASVVAFVQSAGGEMPDEMARPTRVWDLRKWRGPAAQRNCFVDNRSEGCATGDDGAGFSFDVATTDPIPGRPMCHDLSGAVRKLFADLRPLDQLADVPGGQNKTGRNRKYVRRWSEVDPDELRRVEQLGGRGSPKGRWVFYSKGGRFAPWWGNWQWVVDWSEQARRFYRENRTSNLLDEKYWFREGIVYTDFAGDRFNARWMPPGCLFDMTGPAVFPESHWWPELTKRQRIAAALAVLNSSPARRMLRALNPTLHFQVRDVRALPIPEIQPVDAAEIAKRVWTLIDGVRRSTAACEESPLVGENDSGDSGADEIRFLVELEREIDELICEAYGVEVQPIEKASIRYHHQLAPD